MQFVRPSYTFTENGVMGFVEVMKTGVSSSPFTVQVIGGMSMSTGCCKHVMLPKKQDSVCKRNKMCFQKKLDRV